MTNIYAHISNGDAPKSQHVTEVSFVDENGKHVDIGGGGTTEIHTDATLAGTGTTDNPLKLSDNTNSKIAKAGTLTGDNLATSDTIISHSGYSVVKVIKTGTGKLSLLTKENDGIKLYDNFGQGTAIGVPAIPALAAISTLDSSAELTDVINKVNEILNAVKNAL